MQNKLPQESDGASKLIMKKPEPKELRYRPQLESDLILPSIRCELQSKFRRSGYLTQKQDQTICTETTKLGQSRF